MGEAVKVIEKDGLFFIQDLSWFPCYLFYLSQGFIKILTEGDATHTVDFQYNVQELFIQYTY